MNDITLMYQNINKVDWEEKLLGFTDSILNLLEIDNWEFSLTLCDNSYIHKINRDYRDKDKPTDVITFVMSDEPFPVTQEAGEPYSAGDIIISLETVEENSKYFKVSYEEELKRVLIHGILHLMGLDHETNSEDEEMLIKQEKILKDLIGRGLF
ncbi:rRNA maturation RNase YbeY [Thiospirochaeta perfilievii]|uniref:Endoribonuclease YbeY n=1 Tax=Thiospirochaeta perfilievii TaxID=252967 RepID=A0A5C1QHX3_9SPIO|nr:rRNA maturation RNase YbeY [Thiospirochaeta perfilievii]QEN05852.1 rRNA maturation RNase YbeY [Thiospirochaeta perfilievii]